jgi:hypothetical protein
MGPEVCGVCGVSVPEVPVGWKLVATGRLEPRAVLCPSCARDATAVAEAVRTALQASGGG